MTPSGPKGRYAVSYRKPGRLLVAVTNDFSWVQFSTLFKPVPEDKINPTPPCGKGVEVTWRSGHNPPARPNHKPRRHRPRAIEAVSDKTLTVHEFDGRCRVELPDFQFMALLVLTEPGSASG